MTNVLICLALLVFVGVLSLLNQFVKKARSEQMTRMWKERRHRLEPDAPPLRSASRRSRRRVDL